jgi:hypothetical protein
MADEPVTIASETKRLERLNTELADAQKTQDAAISAMSKRQKDAGVEELLTLADAVRDAKRLCDKSQSAINAVKGSIGRLEWEANSKPLSEAKERIRDAQNAAVAREAAVLKQFGVEKLTTATDTTTEKPLTTVNVIGEGIPKPPSTVKRTNGGSRGTKVYQTDNGEMGSRDFLVYAQSRSKKSERIAKMLDDPDAGRKGLTHLAVEVANELGVTIK